MFRPRMLIIWAFLLASGCHRSKPQAIFPPLNVVASVYPLADIARVIGGDAVQVGWVVESGQSLGGVVASPELRNRLHNADLVLSCSESTDPWAVEGSGAAYQSRRIIRLDSFVATDQPGGYLWLDPVIIQAFVSELANRLSAQRPQSTDDFHARATLYIQQLNALSDAYRPRLHAIADKQFLTLSGGFAPLLARFDITPIFVGDASAANIDDSTIRRLRETAQSQHPHALILPADTSAAQQRDLAARTQLRVVPLDALGSSAAGGRTTYLDLLKYDLDQLTTKTSD